MLRTKAIKAIESAGILLVYPVKNQPEPKSIWQALYPRSRMAWDWGEGADDRVVDLWHARTELSESRDVVYTKWFQGRATFFSRPVFAAMLRLIGGVGGLSTLTPEAEDLYQCLLDDSPQTSKMLRATLGLEGRHNEGDFNRRARPLWQRLLTVGFGEIEEGSYPSLAIGATKLLFEDLWDEATGLSAEDALAVLEAKVPADSPFYKQYRRLSKTRSSSAPGPASRGERGPARRSNA